MSHIVEKLLEMELEAAKQIEAERLPDDDAESLYDDYDFGHVKGYQEGINYALKLIRKEKDEHNAKK